MRNKIKRSRSRLISFLTVCVLLLTALLPALTVSAEGTTIDYNRTDGTLTIYKYDEDDVVTDDEGNLIQNESTGLNGVTFTYLWVGNVAQSEDVDDTSEVIIGYYIDNDTLLNHLKTTGGLSDDSIVFTKDGEDYYSASALDAALARLNQSVLVSFIQADGNSTAMYETGSYDLSDSYVGAGNGYPGKTYADGLEVGLYLIVETGYPGTITNTTPAFFVSIPMTTADGSEWTYDVVAYPKNSSSEIDITKNVQEDGGDAAEVDGEIGQMKTFVIRADVPANMSNLRVYRITDTLSSGLTYAGVEYVDVYGVDEDGNEEELTSYLDNPSSYQYTLTYDDTANTLTFEFVTRELMVNDESDPNYGEAEYVTILISYNAYLNENAVVGSTGNGNEVDLYYETYTDTEGDGTTEEAETDGIFTYAVSLQKSFSGEGGNFSDVTFVLYRDEVTDEDDEEDNRIAVAYDSTGFWYVLGENDPSSESYTITIDEEDGTLEIRGLEAGTYYLVETGTSEGYNLLSDPITIIITSNEGTIQGISEVDNPYYVISGEGTYARFINGYLYALEADGSRQFYTGDYTDGQIINFGTSTVYYSKDNGATWIQVGGNDAVADNMYMYSVDGLEWSATVGGSTASEEISGDFGIVSVINQTGFELPATGGSGTLWFIVGGGIVVAIALVSIYAVTRKKRSA